MIIEQKLTPGEEIRKLSRLTEEALVVNDIELLKEIRKIIDTKPEVGGIEVEDRSEWFYCMVPPDILKKI
jgi:hypothetical protein